MVEKSTRGGTCHSNYEYAKTNKKYVNILMKRTAALKLTIFIN